MLKIVKLLILNEYKIWDKKVRMMLQTPTSNTDRKNVKTKTHKILGVPMGDLELEKKTPDEYVAT